MSSRPRKDRVIAGKQQINNFHSDGLVSAPTVYISEKVTNANSV